MPPRQELLLAQTISLATSNRQILPRNWGNAIPSIWIEGLDIIPEHKQVAIHCILAPLLEKRLLWTTCFSRGSKHVIKHTCCEVNEQQNAILNLLQRATCIMNFPEHRLVPFEVKHSWLTNYRRMKYLSPKPLSSTTQLSPSISASVQLHLHWKWWNPKGYKWDHSVSIIKMSWGIHTSLFSANWDIVHENRRALLVHLPNNGLPAR
jgi:hypothetical protein